MVLPGWWSWNVCPFGQEESAYMFIVQVSQEEELWVNMVVLLRRWFWKGHSSDTLGETEYFKLIWKFHLEDHLKRAFVGNTGWDRAFQAITIVLFGKWCRKCHLSETLGRLLTVVDEVVLCGRWSIKGLLLGILGKTLHFHSSGLMGVGGLRVDMIRKLWIGLEKTVH